MGVTSFSCVRCGAKHSVVVVRGKVTVLLRNYGNYQLCLLYNPVREIWFISNLNVVGEIMGRYALIPNVRKVRDIFGVNAPPNRSAPNLSLFKSDSDSIILIQHRGYMRPALSLTDLLFLPYVILRFLIYS